MPQHTHSSTFVSFCFRSYTDVNQMDEHTGSQMNSSFDSEDHALHWHEDSKPGTIV